MMVQVCLNVLNFLIDYEKKKKCNSVTYFHKCVRLLNSLRRYVKGDNRYTEFLANC